MKRSRLLIVVAATAAAICAASLPAWAYFTASATSSISASATSLSAVTFTGAGTTTSTQATVSWTDSNPAGTSYTGTATMVNAPYTAVTCLVSGSSCTASGLSPTSMYSIAIVPALGTYWAGPASFLDVTTQATPTTAAGLAIDITGWTASTKPTMSCDPISANYSCTIKGAGQGNQGGGIVKFTVAFVDTNGKPVVYSASQPSTISESGQNSGQAVIAAGTTTSTSTLQASHTGNSTGTSTLIFGSFKLTVNVNT